MQEVVLSTSDGRRRFVIDDDFCKLCGVSQPNYEGSKAFIISWLTLLSDSPLNCAHSMKPYRLYRSFLSDLQKIGLKNYVLNCSALAHNLAKQHRLYGQSSYIGDWIDDFKDTPVFFEYNRYFSTGDPQLFAYLYTFLCFGKKQKYVDEAFNSVAFRNWMKIENGLANQSFLHEDLSCLREIFRIVLPPFIINEFVPRFGPGSVSERGVRGHIGKIDDFSYDRMIDRFLFHGHIGKYGYGKENGLSFDEVDPKPFVDIQDRPNSSRVARLMFVPKDLKTSRSICMEPNVIQYYQQGIMRVMLELIDKCQFSSFIKLENQGRNKDLARIGSVSTLVDTIDLSSASDCLSYRLVKEVFPPSWQIPMRVARSHSCILPDGSIFPLSKFAPMGSALCFPTQCILFAGVVTYAACQYRYSRTPYTGTILDFIKDNLLYTLAEFDQIVRYNGRDGHFQPCAVYGDDICVDSQLTSYVNAILLRLGFIVNEDKSFTGSQSFRESCGGFYLNGDEVSPLYFRADFTHGLTAECIASLISLANQAFLRGYMNLYRTICREVQRHLNVQYVEPLSADFGFYSDHCSNWHMPRRYNSEYQRVEMRGYSIKYDYYISDDSNITDFYNYTQWMACHRESSSETTEVSTHGDTGGARLYRRWIPVEE